MSKPWDKLRRAAPISAGAWRTNSHAEVELAAVRRTTVDLEIGTANCFDASDLRQLAEFCIELADQLEANG